MKPAKILSATVLLSVLLSGNAFAKEVTSQSLLATCNSSTGVIKVHNVTTFKGNGTAKGDALAEKCNALEKKRVDKYIEARKYFEEHDLKNSKYMAHFKQLQQEKKTMSENMVKEGCFRR